MEDLAKWLLTLRGEQVGVVGLLLTFILVAGWALAKEHIITGSRWRQKVKDHETCLAAHEAAQQELKGVGAEYVEARIELTRLRVEREHGWQRQSSGRRKSGAPP